MKILVLGLGNPILSDDSVGWKVAEAVRQRVDCANVTVQETSLAGLSLLDLLVGYDRAILVDAIRTEDGRPGSVYVLAPEDFRGSPRASSPHDVSFREA
ncbi:MAG: hydrogenase maturation protease, partial [Chloroflexi bacterium]|nr:hydrogenase maturation protease [Chloroflexota bacterium]